MPGNPGLVVGDLRTLKKKYGTEYFTFSGRSGCSFLRERFVGAPSLPGWSKESRSQLPGEELRPVLQPGTG